jgi:hypothetical protein
MRTTLLAVMLAPPAISLVLMLVATMTYRQFRRRVPKIRNEEDIQRLRSLAKLQMYLALVAHPYLTMGAPLVVWLFGWLWARELGLLDLLLYWLVPMIVAFGAAGMGQSPARMALTIPTKDPALASERDRIVETWRKRPLPDW